MILFIKTTNHFSGLWKVLMLLYILEGTTRAHKIGSYFHNCSPNMEFCLKFLVLVSFLFFFQTAV